MAETDWRPIETAPRDGSYILGWISDDEGGHIEQMRYDTSGEEFRSGDYGPFVWASPASVYGIWPRDVVTHWMDLPAPPSKD